MTEQRYQYGIVIAGRVAITTYGQYLSNKEDGYEVVRRTIGEWEPA